MDAARLPNSSKPKVNPSTAQILATFATAVYVPYEESILASAVNNWVGQPASAVLNATGFGPEVKRIAHKFAEKYVIKHIIHAQTGWFVDSSSVFGLVLVKRSQFDEAFLHLTGYDIEQTRNFTQQQFDSLWFQNLQKGVPGNYKFNLWENDKQREIVIAFRGTKSWSDWGSNAQFGKVKLQENAQFGGGKVHSGFQSIYASCQQPLNDKVFHLLPELEVLRKNTLMYVTGHSLGGALATLCALHLYTRHQARRIVPIVYTFASPSVGDSEFVHRFNTQIASETNSVINSACGVRFVRTQDPVVSVLPEKLSYKHVDYLYILDGGNSHAMTGYRTLIETQVAPQLSRASASLFPHLESGFNYSLSNAPILINGMKVIFDQPVQVHTVKLKRKKEVGSGH